MLEDSFSDSGSESDVSTVKTELPKLLTGDVAAGKVTTEEIGGEDTFDADLVEEREELTEEVWAEDQADEQAELLESGLRSAEKDPDPPRYIKNRFVVSKWQGVSVDGDVAYAQLVGHQTYTMEDGTVEPDADEQYQVQLTQNSGDDSEYEWLLFEWKAVQIWGQG